jgi:hypothetical protein
MSARCRFAARGFVVCCLLCVLRPLAAAPAAEDFSIKFSRPSKVGERTLLTGTYQADEDTVVTVAGRENRQEKHAIYRFAVIHKVLAIGAKGNPSRVALAVQKLTREADGATTEVLKAGDVISVRLEGHEEVWELGGAALADELKEALDSIVEVTADDDPTDDDVFGTARRRRIGDSWPVDARLLADQLRRKGLPVTAKDVTGTATLAGTKSVQGVPCLDVRLNIELRDVKLPIPDLPAEVVMAPLTVRFTGVQVLPVNGVRNMLEANLDFRLPLAANGTVEGNSFTMRSELHRVTNVQFSPLS